MIPYGYFALCGVKGYVDAKVEYAKANKSLTRDQLLHKLVDIQEYVSLCMEEVRNAREQTPTPE